MTRKAGISFLDIMIIVGIVLLLAALAIPRFVKVPDYGDERDEAVSRPAVTNASTEATNDMEDVTESSSTTKTSAATQPGG